jgi:hypothetical protein
MANGEWTVEVKVKPMSSDTRRKLLHHPAVVAQLTQIAAKIAATAGTGHQPGRFGIRVQNWPNTKRARAFAIPADSGGIHLELTQHLLVKAAAGSGHRTISGQASGAAQTMAAKQGESAGVVTPAGTIQPSTAT